MPVFQKVNWLLLCAGRGIWLTTTCATLEQLYVSDCLVVQSGGYTGVAVRQKRQIYALFQGTN